MIKKEQDKQDRKRQDRQDNLKLLSCLSCRLRSCLSCYLWTIDMKKTIHYLVFFCSSLFLPLLGQEPPPESLQKPMPPPGIIPPEPVPPQPVPPPVEVIQWQLSEIIRNPLKIKTITYAGDPNSYYLTKEFRYSNTIILYHIHSTTKHYLDQDWLFVFRFSDLPKIITSNEAFEVSLEAMAAGYMKRGLTSASDLFQTTGLACTFNGRNTGPENLWVGSRESFPLKLRAEGIYHCAVEGEPLTITIEIGLNCDGEKPAARYVYKRNASFVVPAIP